MRILVMQLARLGDVTLTRPIIRGLRRKFPKAQIDLIVRETFKLAAEELPVDQLILFPSGLILEPWLTNENMQESFNRLKAWVAEIPADYSQVINLSFSPLSSYLVWLLANSESRISGYTRADDGPLAIPDDASSYFHAQVGVGKSNRVHLLDVFAGIAQVDLDPSEIHEVVAAANPDSSRISKLLFHVGGSEASKSLAPRQWLAILRRLNDWMNVDITLIGSTAEMQIGSWIRDQLPECQIALAFDLKSFKQVVQLVSTADGVVAPDSFLIQVASLANKPALNLSFDSVNFWETGPIVNDSRILKFERPDLLMPNQVAYEVISWLQGTPSEFACAEAIKPRASYERFQILGTEDPFDQFSWQLNQALYMDARFPNPNQFSQEVAELTRLGMSRIYELCEVMTFNINGINQSSHIEYDIQVLQTADEILSGIYQLCPTVRPVIDWFNTERIRIGPVGLKSVIDQTLHLVNKLEQISGLYRDQENQQGKSNDHRSLDPDANI